MTDDERKILEEISGPGIVPPRTFVGRGHVVSWCVRRGWLEWERKNQPRTNRATALFITEAGRESLRDGRRRG